MQTGHLGKDKGWYWGIIIGQFLNKLNGLVLSEVQDNVGYEIIVSKYTTLVRQRPRC